MPNVPNVPGVPPLLSYAANVVTLAAADALAFLFGQAPPQWGLFKGGLPVVAADTVASFDFKRSWAVADYPVEQGAFESYDKVEIPFEVRIRFAAGGSEEARQDLIDSVAAIAGTTDLFDAATPEAVYSSVNVMHFDYRRTAVNGVGMIVMDVWCVEVRVGEQSTFSSTKSPSGASETNGGTVQASPASLTQVGSLPTVQ